MSLKAYLIIGAVLLGGLFLSGIYAKGRADGKEACEKIKFERAIEGVKKHEKINRKNRKLADRDLDDKLRADWLR